ncbi:MAG: FIST N-terminal domain-containing protein [Planctomycetota bacterium]|nr:FIST N-terminal domain-containing protein [Planctomycetota bacterium]
MKLARLAVRGMQFRDTSVSFAVFAGSWDFGDSITKKTGHEPLKFFSAISGADTAAEALEDLKSQIRMTWCSKERADLACLFISADHREDAHELLEGIHRLAEIGALIGCTGESIIGSNKEIEQAPAVSLWLAKMPDVNVLPFAMGMGEISLAGDLNDWTIRTGASPDRQPYFIVLPEPFTSDPKKTLEALNETYEGSTIFGGVPSAGGPGENLLFYNDQVRDEGLVGIALEGDIEVQAVVSQGCRPIGRPFVVTNAQDNLIFELAGEPALQRFQEVYSGLDEMDQSMVKKGLHVGRVVDEYKEDFQRGDFLIRNVLGADKDSGGLAIAERVRVGQTVQFHVRDADSADEDLRELLEQDIEHAEGASPAGALLFSCNGRGTRMFDRPCHDAGVFSEVMGHVPLAGFFAAGEIGPIGNENFIHGFTASLAMFRPRDGS